ncbi:Fe-assimilating 1 [Chlorella sorokiniana]|uniref:Fe-assimilating 1 n=1 Tax=Chlorella sorokiniana TaxID=3076 RepID=A0A2P6TUJ1_CHLSO|nr:Fe-assimilating 1 [Chlorella sorokiniana]|eukprot:PRW57721.1 Fe-assimilating 1 [Chlorella sorokiniana]
MKAAIAAATLFLACLARPASAAVDYTGLSAGGYKFGSDVSGYGDLMIQDVCDFAAAVDGKNFTLAADVYANGANNPEKTLKGWAQSDHAGAPYFDLYATYFNDSLWLDNWVEAGLTGAGPFTDEGARAQVVKKGTQSNLLVYYMFHEVDEGLEAIEAGKLDAAKGAPHKIDEGAALWFGEGCEKGNIANVANKRGSSWGTMVNGTDGCTAATNVAAAEALSKMQAAGLAGDAAAYKAAAADLEKAVVVAEGYTFFRTIAPLVAKADREAAAAVEAAFMAPTTSIAQQVQAAMQPAMEAYGITAADIGTFGATPQCDF